MLKEQFDGLEERIATSNRTLATTRLDLEGAKNLVVDLYKSLKGVPKTKAHLENLSTLKKSLLKENRDRVDAQKVEYDILVGHF